jgi:hypothetical protein
LPGGGDTKVMYFTHYKTKYILYDDMGRVIISTRDKRIVRKIAERIKDGRLADDTRGEKSEVREGTKRKRNKKKKGDEVSDSSATKGAKKKS